MVAVCTASGQLATQIFAHVARRNMGKAAALNRATQLLASVFAPLLSSFLMSARETTTTICYVCAAISLLAILLVHYYGSFMKIHPQYLPTQLYNEKTT